MSENYKLTIMKQLSIEEKAKRYDEAIKVLHKYDGVNIMFSQSLKEEMFPELKESEDEKIRKAVINVFATHKDYEIFFGASVKDILAWLEKQGGPTDEIKPKFEVGDKIKYSSNVYEVLAVKEHYYELSNGNVLEFKDQDKWQLVEQKPAWSEEDETALGDALWCCRQAASIAKDENDMGNVWYAEHWLKSLRPQNSIVTNEELAQAKKDAYNDALDKIEYHSGEPTFDDGWSAAIDYIRKKSLRPQNKWKPSEENIKDLEWCAELVKDKLGTPFHRIMVFIDELKKLREK